LDLLKQFLGNEWLVVPYVDLAPIPKEANVERVRNVTQIRDELYPLLSPADKLLVLDVTKRGWGSFNLTQVINDWFKNNL